MIETSSRMGKMFGLSSFWESKGNEKITGEATKYAMSQGVPIPRPIVSFPRPNMKRRRDVDEILLGDEQHAKKKSKKDEATATHHHKSPSKLANKISLVNDVKRAVENNNTNTKEASVNKASLTPMNSSAKELDALRGIFETQFSLEILAKHEELRLINQELGKCQVALEQLRRCHLIPYPTSKASPFDPVDVSFGTGPTIEPEQGMPRPEWAPAYGVTDGPYTRHYAKWLIPDPKFDGIQPEPQPSERRQVAEGRTTRNSFADGSTPTVSRSGRSQRGSTTKLQALSNGYPPPKGKSGPCTLKRGADGKFVKLVCRDCNREDFSSTQGFINHCRIAHKRDYKSHEEAAVACGEPIEVDESGAIVGDERSPTVAPTTGLVHPLINSVMSTNAAAADKQTYLSLMSHIGASIQQFRRGELPDVKAIPTLTPSHQNANGNPNFVASSQTPYLSQLLQTIGFDGNLDELVTEANTQGNLEEEEEADPPSPVAYSSNDDDVDSDAERKSKKTKKPISRPRGGGGLLSFDGAADDFPPHHPTMRIPARSTMSPAPYGRPVSSKGYQSGISPRISYATPINTAAANNSRLHQNSYHVIDSAISVSSNAQDSTVLGQEALNSNSNSTSNTTTADPSPICDLSPNTVASNNDLPALVSDDGEYDDDEDNDDDGKSLSSEEGSEVGSDDVAEIIEDGEDQQVMQAERRLKIKKEDGSKHVTFVSPVKEKGKGGKKDGRGRK